MSARVREEAAAVVVLVVATLVAARPWSVDPGLAFTQGDTAFTLVHLLHLQDAALQQVPLAQGALGWPLVDGIARTDWVLGPALLGLPLRALGADPFTQHAVLVLLGLLGTAWAVHAVARALLGPGPHTWVAGVVGGLGPLQLGHAAHLNLVWHGPLIAGALALGVGLHRRRPGLAALGGALLAASFHFGLYLGARAALVGLAVGAVAALWRRGDARTWAAGAAGLMGMGLSVVPVLVVYGRAASAHGAWMDTAAVAAESWDLAETLRPITGSVLEGLALGLWPAHTSDKVWLDPVNPGWLALALALVGLAALARRGGPDREHRWAWVALALVGAGAALLALGPELTWKERGLGVPGPYALLAWLPGFGGLRAPVRLLVLTAGALGVLAAAGVRWGAGRTSRRWRWGVGLLAVAVVMVDWPTATAQPRERLAVEGAYLLVDSDGQPGALLDTALVRDTSCASQRRHALYAALWHGRPLVGGQYARRFEAAQRVGDVAAGWPSAESRALLARAGVRLVLEHPPLARPGPSDLECRESQGHRLCILPASAALPGPSSLDDLVLAEPGALVLPQVRGAVGPHAGEVHRRHGRGPP